ncbi:MAG: putative ABC transport system permease protein [Cyclobacteriaceae bacterium]|jgi:putative ABC transport system permease protein
MFLIILISNSISYETLNNRTRNEEGVASSETAWGWYDFNTYVLLEEGSDVKDFDIWFEEYLLDERGGDFEKYNYKQEFPLQAITDIHLYFNLLQESEPDEQGDGESILFLSVLAFFILLIAWINYANLASARSVERAKEVGVRKVMGAHKRQLINQFLSESFVLNFLSLLLGMLIVVLSIRSFNQLTDSRLTLVFLSDPMFWIGTLAFFVLGSVVSGIYPAFVLSSFKPVTVLKGKMSANQSGKYLRKGLVVFQFVASISMIAGTMIVYQQLSHMKSVDTGFDMTETLVVKGPQIFGVDSVYKSTQKAFIETLLNKPEIESVTASSNIPGDEIFWTNGIKRNEENDDTFKIIHNAAVDYKYFPTYGIKILAGRNYEPTYTTDTSSIILNKTAIESLGFLTPEEAINKKVTFWGRPKSIIGVVDDYNQMSVKSKVLPIAFPLALNNSYFTLKLNSIKYQDVFSLTQVEYDRQFPKQSI